VLKYQGFAGFVFADNAVSFSTRSCRAIALAKAGPAAQRGAGLGP
jgi:hypothetical protein